MPGIAVTRRRSKSGTSARHSAIMNAILDVNRSETGESLVDPEKARHALVIATAMILEVDPNIRTVKDMREAGEMVGREVRLQIKALRDEHERTGRRAWNASPVAIQ